MFKRLAVIGRFIEKFKNPSDSDLEQYYKLLDEINVIQLHSKSDRELKEISAMLRNKAASGVPEDELMSEAFALAREASGRVLGMRPFDVQILAGICMHKGMLVEMQTGEGKTLAAVMPAYLNALTAKGVHVLTFNDYLAHRDAEWMGPVYEFLGRTAGYINEGMSSQDRQRAYSADITYVTAREAGFDYLRDFLCVDKEKLVHKPFNYAIVDEADSIMIDEARVPLVIAGEVKGNEEKSIDLCKTAGKLKNGVDYEIDQHGRNVYLTDEGLLHAERILGCGDLYKGRNLELLTGLNCALHAQVLLEKDRDYIVRNGKIEIVDEFTGRIADKRHWPDKLQAAVAAKEGIVMDSGGMVMGTVTLQHFLSLYPKISGMTGTALTASEEFRDMYCIDVAVIPTNKPCKRVDHPVLLYTCREEKQRALLAEIERIHSTGQPILIGTGSVNESELLAEDLERVGIECTVLNAKNDELEAAIIAKAGEPGAVTVSTNMAGRGVDIKLGENVAAMGGLYIIGTSLNESRRIDNQLRGRAGRQGDPGESRLFISLEDGLIRKYGISELASVQSYLKGTKGLIDDHNAVKDVLSAQKIIEGYNSDIRLQLAKYTFILEQQRRIIHRKRQDILVGKFQTRLLEEKSAERYEQLCKAYGKEIIQEVEKQLTLFYINKYWTEYLDYISYMREGIHLVAIAKKEPLHEFNRIAVEAFDDMLQTIEEDVIKTFDEAEISAKGIDMEKEGLEVPSSTWTYLINDSPGQFARLPLITKLFSDMGFVS